MGGTCSAYRGQEICIQGLWGDLMERDHLRPKRKWEDNIKMDLQEIRWGGMD